LIENLRATSSGSTELQVHFSKTVVWCSSGGLVKIFFEVRMSLSKVNNVLYEETIIPCRLLLDSTNSIVLLWGRVNRREHWLLYKRWLNNNWRRLNNYRCCLWRWHQLCCIYHISKSLSHRVNQVSLWSFRFFGLRRCSIRCEQGRNCNCTSFLVLMKKLQSSNFSLVGCRNKFIKCDWGRFSHDVMIFNIFIHYSENNARLSIQLCVV
jgi:hypothetical protein